MDVNSHESQTALELDVGWCQQVGSIRRGGTQVPGRRVRPEGDLNGRTIQEARESGKGRYCGRGATEAPRSIAETVTLLREKLGDALVKGELKGTLADYIKLIQLEKEVTEDEIREIIVHSDTTREPEDAGEGKLPGTI